MSNKQPTVLVSDLPVDAVIDQVETVDQRTGKRVVYKAYTPDEITKVLREAPMAVGRDPLMLGVRTAEIPGRQIREVVEASRRAEGSFIRIGQETFTKTIGR